MDLIDRQAVLDGLASIAKEKAKSDAQKSLMGRVMFFTEQLPPSQPEIVRCKDCKYAEYIDDVQTLWCTECGQGRTVAPYDFCSYGERREDE